MNLQQIRMEVSARFVKKKTIEYRAFKKMTFFYFLELLVSYSLLKNLLSTISFPVTHDIKFSFLLFNIFMFDE